MPELPEVEITKRALQSKIEGKTLKSFWTDWQKGFKSRKTPRAVSREIRNKKVGRLQRRGKVLFMPVAGTDYFFAVHLKMSGSLLYGKPNEILKHSDKKHVHNMWKFKDGAELWFDDPRKFGIVWYGTDEDFKKDPYIGTLGPDALSISWLEFKNLIRKHKGMIKPLLLRQDIIAGLGNIAVDEILWQAGVNPKKSTEKISFIKLKDIYKAMKRVLKRIISLEGNTLRDWILPDGRKGKSALRLNVYGKEGERCPKCGEDVKKTTVGGRGTHFCQKCQKPPE